MFECKVFELNCLKTLHLPLVRRNAPVEIRIVTMAKFHKSGLFKPFLWNCAATAARINRKAVYSVDIIINGFTGFEKPFPGGGAEAGGKCPAECIIVWRKDRYYHSLLLSPLFTKR